MSDRDRDQIPTMLAIGEVALFSLEGAEEVSVRHSGKLLELTTTGQIIVEPFGENAIRVMVRSATLTEPAP